MSQTVIISANPKSGSASSHERVEALKREIESIGLGCEIFNDLGQMADRCRELDIAGRLRTVVAAGGDGTASKVASLIPDGVPLTLFPTGSENLLAKYFSITADPVKCARSIDKLRTVPIDVMMVDGKWSLLMASVGFDAEVVRQVHLSRDSHVTKLNYLCAIVANLFRYRWPAMKVSILDENNRVIEEVFGGWVFVFNVPRYAAGLSIMDDSVEHDGYLDIGVFDAGGMLQSVWYYWNVIRGKHHSLKQWRRFRSGSLRIEYANHSDGSAKRTSCQADGDWICDLPVEIRIAKRNLRIVN